MTPTVETPMSTMSTAPRFELLQPDQVAPWPGLNPRQRFDETELAELEAEAPEGPWTVEATTAGLWKVVNTETGEVRGNRTTREEAEAFAAKLNHQGNLEPKPQPSHQEQLAIRITHLREALEDAREAEDARQAEDAEGFTAKLQTLERRLISLMQWVGEEGLDEDSPEGQLVLEADQYLGRMRAGLVGA